jgi:F-type H+-transporting ATPase subunit b
MEGMLTEIYPRADDSLAVQGMGRNHIARIKGVLDGARAEHTQAVKDRIDAVGQMKDVVSLTKGLFAVSKVRVPPSPLRDSFNHTFAASRSQDTAQLEADAFVRRQHVALAAEVKAVLDSWVRFEQQEKENEQARLVKTIVDNVLKSVSEEKTQRDVLVWAVAEVERENPPFLLLEWQLMTDDGGDAELVKTKAI